MQCLEEFYRAVGWRDAKERLCLSSARVALRRLEEQGQVQLPPPRAGGKGISGLRLHLTGDETDPSQRLWNRLIVREHPLGNRPLVGAQLRYRLGRH